MKPTTKSFLWGTLTGILLGIGLLVALAFSYYYVKMRSLKDEASIKLEAPRLPPAEGFSFDQFELTTLSGQSYLTNLLAGKVVLLNVWATWCPGCVWELPSLISLRKKLQARDDVVVLCVSDISGNEQVSFLKAKNFSPDMFLYSRFVGSELGRNGLPVTYIFDKKRNLVFQELGAAKWDDDTVVNFLSRVAEKK